MNAPAYLHARGPDVMLAVKLQPRASANDIGEALGGELKIKVTAAPVDAAANEALVRLLADRLACPRGAVQLVRGQTSRHKQVLIRGMSAEAVAARLAGSSQT
ncbi:MAG: DUF167 domain-containing protein [Verrucomicrobia bacterium]|nr:DUF167 domain-containing protein [Verrucomicrobiota bacterium]